MFSQIILFFKAANVLSVFQGPPTFSWHREPKKLDWVRQAKGIFNQPIADAADEPKFIQDIYAFVNDFLD